MSTAIQPTSNLISGAALSGVRETPKPQAAGAEPSGRPQTPRTDEYVPEEKREPSGLYRLGRDEDGRPKVYVDGPEREAGASEKQGEIPGADSPGQDRGADGPVKRASGQKTETCTGSTDKVDRELEKLKKKQEKLKRQINAETDDARIQELEKELAQVDGELRQKDNDAYRRRHTVFS